MKKIILFAASLLITAVGFAQDGITVCHTSSTDKFALFASNKSFNAAHSLPRAYVHISKEGGKMITFKCLDGKDGNGYAIMALNRSYGKINKINQ